MADTPNIIEVENLVKSYGGKVAVDHLSFAIKKGGCFGLLGPNGAGKTTTVEIIEDILSPDAGKVLYNGKTRDAGFKQQIGIQFQQTELLGYLTVKETLSTFAAFYDRHLDVEDVVQMCMLENVSQNMNNRISGGQRQRLLLGLALLNDPELIFLDEPSTGLDPQARQHVWEIIRQMKQKGKTIVLTTHYMEEAQVLCDMIAIMDQGKIIEQGSPEALIEKHCEEDEFPRDLESVFLKLTGKYLRD